MSNQWWTREQKTAAIKALMRCIDDAPGKDPKMGEIAEAVLDSIEGQLTTEWAVRRLVDGHIITAFDEQGAVNIALYEQKQDHPVPVEVVARTRVTLPGEWEVTKPWPGTGT